MKIWISSENSKSTSILIIRIFADMDSGLVGVKCLEFMC